MKDQYSLILPHRSRACGQAFRLCTHAMQIACYFPLYKLFLLFLLSFEEKATLQRPRWAVG